MTFLLPSQPLPTCPICGREVLSAFTFSNGSIEFTHEKTKDLSETCLLSKYESEKGVQYPEYKVVTENGVHYVYADSYYEAGKEDDEFGVCVFLKRGTIICRTIYHVISIERTEDESNPFEWKGDFIGGEE